MKITIENTTKIIKLVVNGCEVPARVWQGETEGGIPVQCYITRIAPEILKTALGVDELTKDFDREFERKADPRPSVEGIPLRMFID